MIGRRIARFTILAKIGQGGMATVWKARDERLQRTVALKVLNEDLAGEERLRARFRREAEIEARLEHPAIVPVYEAGEDEGSAYLVMKLIDGETLSDYVRRRLPSIDDVTVMLDAVLDALAYAHARGVIHRDVTPRNIMRDGSGRYYVLDFGLARVPGMLSSSSGHVVGTPGYISPERLRGADADARSDLFSLGIVSYLALTGSLPFPDGPVEVRNHGCLNVDAPPPSRMRPEIEPGLDRLVCRLTAREPLRRPATADEAAAMLDEALGRGSNPPRRSVAGTIGNVAPHTDPSSADETRPTEPMSPREGAGGRYAAGHTEAYLAVPPIACAPEDAESPARRSLLEGLHEATRAGLAHLGRVHVILTDRIERDGDRRAFARLVGANLVLETRARFTGTAVRLTYHVLDPERDLEIAGGIVDGSVLQAFDTEDRFVRSVASSLEPRGRTVETRTRTHDPAAAERLSQAIAHLRRIDHEASIDAAIRLLEDLIASEGESAALLATLARACLLKHRLTRARFWEGRASWACDRAATLDPDAPAVLLAMGELHVAGGRFAEALPLLERALAIDSALYEAHLARALALQGLRRGTEAEAACRAAIALRPDDARGHHTLGLVLFRLGRYADALVPWRRVTELTPDNAGAYRNLGSAFFHLDSNPEAIAALEKAIDIRPHAMAYYNLGTVLFFLDRRQECIDAFEKGVALNDADPRAWGNLGNACRLIPGHEARQREALERAVGLARERLDRDPGSGEDWSQLSGWLAGLGRRAEAEQAIERALTMAPDDPHCMAAAGHTFLLLGARDQALEWLRRAVAGGYGVDALRRSPDLRELHGESTFERILAHAPANGAVSR